MSAKDYIICKGIKGLYLAKRLKAQTVISKDRRPISDNEIIGCFEYYLRRRCKEVGDSVIIISDVNGPIFEAKLLRKEEEE